MAVNVTALNSYDEHSKADNFHIVDGHLYVVSTDDYGNFTNIAVYAPANWRNAVVES